MQTITIENFGPVKYFTAEVKDVMLLIGPQASGKSTISKVIFFFKEIKDELMRFIYEVSPKELEHPINSFSLRLKQKFIDCFGVTTHLPNFVMKYDYSDTKSAIISLDDKSYVRITFNENILDELNLIFREVQEYNNKTSRYQSSYTALSDLLEVEAEKRAYLKLVENRVINLFEEIRSTLFIPAGRSLLSTLADQISFIDPYTLDFFMKSFVEKINRLKPSFKDSLTELVEQKKNLTEQDIDFDKVNLAIKLTREILKGDYKFERNMERIYFNEEEYVKLQYASSGQQESIWILLLIFRYILDKEKVFIVFEEPEAHLYPETQESIVQLIGLVANVENNQVIVTTHSPYILSSFNNLLYAYQLGVERVDTEPEDIAKIIERNIWINPERTAAYSIAGKHYESIIDEDLKLIQAEKIDSASRIINDKFNQLFKFDN